MHAKSIDVVPAFTALCVCVISIRLAAEQPADPQNVSAENQRIAVEDIDGAAHKPLDVQNVAAHVLVFTTTECPIANSYAPEINRLVAKYCDKGFQFYLVHVDPQITAASVRKHRDEYGYQLPVLVDQKQKFARAVGATVTPEAAVVCPDGKLAYRGCIDDLFANLGQKRQQPRHAYLRQTLEELASGKPVSHPRTKAVGCIIQFD